MSAFNTLERKIGGLLAGKPAIKRFAKDVYQRLNYMVYRQAGFRFELADGWDISTPSNLIGDKDVEPTSEEFFGYFDRSPWDASERFYVTHVRQRGQKQVSLKVYDFEAGTSKTLGDTSLWTLQQGAMPHWLILGGNQMVGFNQLCDARCSMCVVDPVSAKTVSVYPLPIQAVNLKISKFRVKY